MKVEISKIIKTTAGHFHCWCESSVGSIRKPNTNVPQFLWDTFWGKNIVSEISREAIESAEPVEAKVGSNDIKTKLNMTKELLFRDTLLYIAIIVTSYGAAVLEANFTNGIIALLLGAGLTILRTILKKQ